MRTYPCNSAEAAARLVGLVLISDGHVCRSEVEALNALGVEPALGLAPGGFGGVVHALCEDLLMATQAGGTLVSGLDDETLGHLMAEVNDPELQRRVIRLASAAAQADRHLAEGERHVLEAARRHWALSAEPLQAA